jgi:DNA-directed RNA polymerase I and III subunit RPAC1
MAIEKVVINNNTGVMQDEVLAHRLGLIPIKTDPSIWDFSSGPDDFVDTNTIVFELKVACQKKGKSRGDFPADQKYIKEKGTKTNLLIENPYFPKFIAQI